jgi:ergothioneine biosynthesis protein EgtB
VKPSIQEQLRETWARSDQIFALIDPAFMYAQPISLRHPVIFYLGHLPAFAWNQVCRGLLGTPPFQADFDELFERGIDPMGVDSHDSGADWPAVPEVLEYRDRVRQELLAAVEAVAELARSNRLASRNRIFAVAIEHELMHQETLQYMFQRFPLDCKRRPEDLGSYLLEGAAPPGVVEVGGGPVKLGADFSDIDFGWDNEFPGVETEVGDFRIDRTPVRNAEYLEFVEAGGYQRPELWSESDWEWRARTGVDHPSFWSRADGSWMYHTLFDQIPLERAADWPVYASRAEATAYCRWRGGRLPTEAEFHRAAYSTPGGELRRFPWGDEAPGPEHGNFDFRHWAPTPVGARPDGDSAWGVAELVGNGWEWTDTVFEPFPDFEAYIPSYPGYSTDFFDGQHYVMLGASWATPAPLIRRSFRNWFQGHYPYMFAKFRCVHDR